MKKFKKRVLLWTLFITIIAGNSISALTFNDVVSDLDKTYDVRSARLQMDQARKTVDLRKSSGDISFSLTPAVKTITENGGDFPGEIDYYGSSSITVPLGLSSEEKEMLSFANDSLNLSADNIKIAKMKAFAAIHNLYQNSWLLQEEKNVLELELDALKTQVTTLTEQYKNGNVSLSVLSAAEEDLQNKQEEVYQEVLKQRIALYELAFTSNKGITKEEVLDRYVLKQEVLPLPPELTIWAMGNQPDLKEQQTKVRQIQQTINRLGKTDIDISIKPFFSSGDHSVSIEYTLDKPELTAAYTFPLYTDGYVPVSGDKTNDDNWETGLSINLSWNSDKTDSLNIDILKNELKQETARLDYLTNYISLQIRSSYQEYLKAKDSLNQAKRDLKRKRDNKKIVETKESLGQASQYEIKEAEALVKRGEWRVESARIDVEKSYLNTAVTAVWGVLYE